MEAQEARADEGRMDEDGDEGRAREFISSIDLDDVVEAFIGSLLAGVVLLFAAGWFRKR